MPDYLIAGMDASNLSGAVSLQRACFPPPFPADLLWTEAHLEKHVALFPEGQFVVLAEGTVIGSASNCIVTEESWSSHASWEETVGGPFLRNHNPGGTTLYGLDISVHPDWRGKGVMRYLYQARFELVRRLGLTRYGTAVRIPGFDSYQTAIPGSPPEDYVRAVESGVAVDRTLTPMLKVGLRVSGVIRDYMEDQESHNAAAVLEWRP